MDVSNAPSLDGPAALRFFETSGHNLLSAARAAGVRHHIALSIVGVDGLLASAYFRAKKIQETLIEASGTPFTILRSTQFFEFISAAVQDGTAHEIPISPALVQPIAGDDVADMLADAVFSDPFNAALEIAGPEQFRLDEIAGKIATAYEDGRRVVADIDARYFGAVLGKRSLLPGPDARISALRFDDWVRDSLQPGWAKTLAS
ncbi:SDR family oxidoreductase [Sphingomonas sp. LM7]|uniref:SDR family oxidoreductase n=1 Tax=Sphingomonas sp. LM7 TaxID=1938607 RepID=UPI001C0AA7FF|nr:NAD(P)H-binding protein [Sphingomonas sp. LM7]